MKDRLTPPIKGCLLYTSFVDFVKDTYKKCELEEIFENSDIVSIHLPVLDSTKGMINAEFFAKMKEMCIRDRYDMLMIIFGVIFIMIGWPKFKSKAAKAE